VAQVQIKVHSSRGKVELFRREISLSASINLSLCNYAYYLCANSILRIKYINFSLKVIIP